MHTCTIDGEPCGGACVAPSQGGHKAGVLCTRPQPALTVVVAATSRGVSRRWGSYAQRPAACSLFLRDQAVLPRAHRLLPGLSEHRAQQAPKNLGSTQFSRQTGRTQATPGQISSPETKLTQPGADPIRDHAESTEAGRGAAELRDAARKKRSARRCRPQVGAHQQARPPVCSMATSIRSCARARAMAPKALCCRRRRGARADSCASLYYGLRALAARRLCGSGRSRDVDRCLTSSCLDAYMPAYSFALSPA